MWGCRDSYRVGTPFYTAVVHPLSLTVVEQQLLSNNC